MTQGYYKGSVSMAKMFKMYKQWPRQLKANPTDQIVAWMQLPMTVASEATKHYLYQKKSEK